MYQFCLNLKVDCVYTEKSRWMGLGLYYDIATLPRQRAGSPSLINRRLSDFRFSPVCKARRIVII